MDKLCACGTTFQARNPRAKFCSDRCRKRDQRGGAAVVAMPTSEPASPTVGVHAATLRELTEANRHQSALGQACLTLAARLDAPGVDTGSAMAAVAKQLDAMLREATKGAGVRTGLGQLQDELAARRARQA